MPVARLLTDEDAPLLRGLLAPATVTATMLCGLMRRGGLSFRGQDWGADYIGAFAGGRLVAVLAHSAQGMLYVHAEEWAAIPDLVSGLLALREKQPRPLEGISGLKGPVEAVAACLGLGARDWRRWKEEGLYAAPLADVPVPATLLRGDWRVRPAGVADYDTLFTWRYGYVIEMFLATPGPDLEAQVHAELQRRIGDDFFVLEADDRLVSLVGCSVAEPGVAHISPVWTPPDARGQGFARACVSGALHLAALPETQMASLYTENPAAVRAYEAIGFRRVGAWCVGHTVRPLALPLILPMVRG